MRAGDHAIEVSVVLPCLDEATTVASCVRAAQAGLGRAGLRGEVIVVDNASTDGSAALAAAAGARVVPEPERGYGRALVTGLWAARGDVVIMADADGSYDLTTLAPLTDAIRAGADLVVGNRFAGGIAPGAMPRLHRYLGNPVLSALGRLLFRSPCHDFHCGLRAVRRKAALDLDLRATGMEFASEMVVKAALGGLTVAEVPVTLSPAGRAGRSHLRPWRDGWRHLRFMLLFSPRWLFLYPGLALMAIGLLLGTRLVVGPLALGGAHGVDIHTLVFAGAAVLLGFQALSFAIFARLFGTTAGFLPVDPRLQAWARFFRLEVGLAIGAVLVLAGAGLAIAGVATWGAQGFGALDPRRTMRLVVPAVTALTLGVQVILNSCLFSLLSMSRRATSPRASSGSVNTATPAA